MSLTIGKVGRRRFELPTAIATQAMAIHGVRGKGKTVTAAVIVEELLGAGIQVVAIDPTDVWWGLKSSADGKRPGHQVVILGGPHGDLPLQAAAGAIIADFVVDRGPSVILSLRHLRKSEQRRFVTDFAEQLYHRKGEVENRTPLFLAIDEASQFVPQRVQGDSARMVGAIQDIVRLGRSAGLGCALIDQRPATVNKDVLTQIELLACHAVTAPQDRKALDDWISQKDSAGHRDEFLEHLASLPRGEAWFWFPIEDVFERVAVRMRETFDSSKTPEIGEQPVAPEARAEVDLDALRAELEDTIAAAEANDPKRLKGRIAELEAEVSRLQQADVLDEDRAYEIVEERDRYVTAALREQRERFVDEVRPLLKAARAMKQVGDLVDELLGEADECEGLVSDHEEDVDLIEAGDGTAAPMSTAQSRTPPVVTHPRETREPAAGVETDLEPRHKRILDALLRLEAMGMPRPMRRVLAIVSEYSPKSSGYDKAVSRLSSLGLVGYPGPGLVELTPEGRSLADAPKIVLTLREFHQGWFRVLEPRHVRILKQLIEFYPRSLSRELLAERSDYSPKSSGYDKAVSHLSSFGLAHYPQAGFVAATDLLFPAALS